MMLNTSLRQTQTTNEAIEMDPLHCVKTCWLAGSWEDVLSFVQKDEAESSITSLYKVSALMMLARHNEARNVLAGVCMTDRKRFLLLRFLISGAEQALSNARRCLGHEAAAKALSRNSLARVVSPESTDYWEEMRELTQFRQIGLPYVALPAAPVNWSVNLGVCLKRLSTVYNDALPIKVAEAEHLFQEGHYDESIRRWQAMASQLGEDMPQAYYERLRDAYQLSGGFPKAAEVEEYTYGDLDKHLILQHVHDWLRPEFYLEIGVQLGKSLGLAKCPSIGVDPMPMLRNELPPKTELVRLSSDEFFETMSYKVPSASFDLAFVDGMHLFEYVLRDFINIEALSHRGTIVIIDDIYPGHEVQALRERKTRAWTGDVWKVFDILRAYRKDLILLPINAYPTGLLLIAKLDRANSILASNYTKIVSDYKDIADVPEDYLRRTGAWTGDLASMEDMVRKLRNQLN